MIPYPTDTTDPVPVEVEPVIGPSPFLDRPRRWLPRRVVAGACVAALVLHGYAFAILPGALDIDVEEPPVVDVNLSNDEIGYDVDIPTNYNVERIEDVSIPGPINPNEQPPGGK